MAESYMTVPAGANRERVKTIRETTDDGDIVTPVVAVEAAAMDYQVNPTSQVSGFVTITGSAVKEEVFATSRRETDIMVKEQDVFVEIDPDGNGYKAKFMLPASIGLIIYAVPDRVKKIRFSNANTDGAHNGLYQVKGSV